MIVIGTMGTGTSGSPPSETIPTEVGSWLGTCDTPAAGPVTVKICVSTLAIVAVTVKAALVTVMVRVVGEGAGRTTLCS